MEQDAKRAIPPTTVAYQLGDEYPSTVAAETATGRGKVRRSRLAPPAVTILGAGGDLTKRSGGSGALSLPTSRQAPDEFAVVGVDHNGRTTVQWRLSRTIMMPGLAGIDALA